MIGVDIGIEALQWKFIEIDSVEGADRRLLSADYDIIGVILCAVLREHLVGDGGVTTLLRGVSRSRGSVGRDGLEGRHGSIRRQGDAVGEEGRRETIDTDVVSTDIA